jgi:hypothetical protein
MTHAEVGLKSASEKAKGKRPNFAMPYLLALVGGVLPVFISPDAFIFPIGAMLLYLFLGYGAAAKDGQMFEFADSFYYLGFALSMASLLASLEPFGPQSSSPDPKAILHRFGLGMFTTLIGVGGRTVLQMFHRLPHETLESTNQRIQEEATIYLTGLTELREKVVAQVSQIADSASASQRALSDALGQERARLDATSAALERNQGEFAQQVDNLSRCTGMAATALEGYRAAGGGLAAEFGSIQSAAVSLLSAIRALQGELGSLQGTLVLDTIPAQAALDGLGRTVDVSTEIIRRQLAANAEAVNQFSDRLAETSVRPLEQAVADLTTRISKIAIGLSEDGNGLRTGSVADLRRALEEAGTEARKFNALLDQIADAVTAKIDRIR